VVLVVTAWDAKECAVRRGRIQLGMEGDAAAAEAAARIRVVRCPKCDKFLPELPPYSVYVCGGCGAALQGTCPPPALRRVQAFVDSRLVAKFPAPLLSSRILA
jgi:ribosomal protein L37AE/L43A